MGADPTVLIVDDERELADLYANWLAEEYTVRTAYNGEQAIEQLDAAVDVVLLDRRMPGLSGDEVLDRIREQEYDCRVAMVTAVEPDFDIIELGFDDYLTKPASKADLHDIVEELLSRKTYDETLQDYYALVSKRATLEAEKPRSELSGDTRYEALTERIAEHEAELDRHQDDMEPEDYAAALRDLGRADDE